MIRTAECVTPQHPDKICDRISDAILDAALEKDPLARVAIETMGGHGIITITGEMTTKSWVDIPSVVRTIMDGESVGIQVNVVQQSREIANGVDAGGAGDQGIMVGYATNETDTYMPLEHYLARSLCIYLDSYYETDGKTQVTVNNRGEVDNIVASFQGVKTRMLEIQIRQWLQMNKLPDHTLIRANPAGDWDTGGFDADTGLTGRKLIVDNYGPQIPIGGGAYSGKDPTKVDRSGAYMARYIAKKYLIEQMAINPVQQMEVFCKLAYAIGQKNPVQSTIVVNTWESSLPRFSSGGTSWEIDVRDAFPMLDLSPQGIIEKFDLRNVVYEHTARWGAYGYEFPWDLITEPEKNDPTARVHLRPSFSDFRPVSNAPTPQA